MPHHHIHTENLANHAAIGQFFAHFPMPNAFIDARDLPCPMPLLALKIALKNPAIQSIYLLTNRPESSKDISTFCQKNKLDLTVHQHTGNPLGIFCLTVNKKPSNS